MNDSLQLLESATEFHGVKIAIVNDHGHVLLHLRDNIPGLFNANMYDCIGGGRDGDETALTCIQRETKEECAVDISEEDIVWVGVFPAQKDPRQKALFCVAQIDNPRLQKLELHEGQSYRFFAPAELLSDVQVIPAIKERYQTYLDAR